MSYCDDVKAKADDVRTWTANLGPPPTTPPNYGCPTPPATSAPCSDFETWMDNYSPWANGKWNYSDNTAQSGYNGPRPPKPVKKSN